MRGRTGTRLVTALLASTLLLAACGGSEEAAPATDGGASGAGAPIKIGVVTSTTGLLSTYGAAYLAGLEAGMDYATDGTRQVDGRKVELEILDDAGDPEKAISAATDLVGRGVKVLAGTASSGVALQLAPFAQENDVLYISGAAASDAVTGINKNTFRAGRQNYQDIATAASLLDDASGDVLVFAQDTEFGKGNVAAVEAILGAKGAEVTPVLAPAATTEFTPFAQQINTAKPSLLVVAWAGETTGAMWQALQQQGVFESTTVATGLGDKNSWKAYGDNPADIDFLAHFVPGTLDNEVAQAMESSAKIVDIFTPDGFVTAQMIVRALSEGNVDDTASMITALEGWEFDAPKGRQTIRASDHAMLQPMFGASLEVGADGTREGSVTRTLEPDTVAPPEKS